ncbi:RNA-binding protein 43-like [Oncorhynchus clarkii lewisi]|uniref:RNA-binding protein 43-like n=1 Tax=Oncorhynchus clarkii lewisi TaxID=490388 RepID=UPI0039B9CE2F
MRDADNFSLFSKCIVRPYFSSDDLILNKPTTRYSTVMEGTPVEVLGVPDDILASVRMVDKLTIHFQRPGNGGGEVKRVQFPSYSPGQAFVIFEDPEVAARVSQRTHVLEVDGQHFPLKIRNADTPEVDVPVKVDLDVSMFSKDSEEVLQPVNEIPQLPIQGSFQKFTAVKAQLQQVLPQDTNTLRHSSPSPSSLNSHASGAISKSSIRCNPFPSPQATGYVGDNLTHVRNTSPKPVEPISQTSGTHPPNQWNPSPKPVEPISQTPSPKPVEPISQTPSPSEVFFITDTDVLRYAQCVRKKDIDSILGGHTTQMDVKPAEGSDLHYVFIEGKSPEGVMEKLQVFFNKLHLRLRTQEIPLWTLDRDRQIRIHQLVQKYNIIYPTVLVDQVGDLLRLVGPSKESYEMKQRLLGKPIDLLPAGLTGRVVDRSTHGAPIPWAPSPVPDPVSATAPDY